MNIKWKNIPPAIFIFHLQEKEYFELTVSMAMNNTEREIRKKLHHNNKKMKWQK